GNRGEAEPLLVGELRAPVPGAGVAAAAGPGGASARGAGGPAGAVRLLADGGRLGGAAGVVRAAGGVREAAQRAAAARVLRRVHGARGAGPGDRAVPVALGREPRSAAPRDARARGVAGRARAVLAADRGLRRAGDGGAGGVVRRCAASARCVAQRTAP